MNELQWVSIFFGKKEKRDQKTFAFNKRYGVRRRSVGLVAEEFFLKETVWERGEKKNSTSQFPNS